MKRVAGLFLLCSAIYRPVFAQSTFGSLTGTVTDPSGAVIARAMVTATNQDTQEARTTVSRDDGTYLIVNMNPGVYKVSVEASGFKNRVTDGVQLLARQAARLNASLEVGTAGGETVDVTASVGVIETEVPTIADSKSGREINELALNFRATDNTVQLPLRHLVPAVKRAATT